MSVVFDITEPQIDSALRESLKEENFLYLLLKERNPWLAVTGLGDEDGETEAPTTSGEEKAEYKYSVDLGRFKTSEEAKTIYKRWKKYRRRRGLASSDKSEEIRLFSKHLDEFANFFGPFMGPKLFAEKRGTEIEKIAKSNLLIKNEKEVIAAFDKLPKDHGAKIIVFTAMPDAGPKLIHRVNAILKNASREEVGRAAPAAPAAPEEEPEIIVPEFAGSGGARFIGGLHSVGHPLDVQIREFLEPSEYAEQFAALIRSYATMKVIKKAEEIASGEEGRVVTEEEEPEAPPNAKQILDKILPRAKKEFGEFLNEINRKLDNPEEFKKFVQAKVKELEEAAELVKKSRAWSREYNKLKFYIEPLMNLYANMMKKYKFSGLEEPEEEETVAEPTEEPESVTEAILNEDKLTEIVINFEQIRKNQLNESFLAMFGAWIKHILGAMFGGFNIPVSVQGSRKEVESFARAVGSEKRYVDTARKYGLDHPTTYKNKAKLDNSIKGFEKETGIKWPFK